MKWHNLTKQKQKKKSNRKWYIFNCGNYSYYIWALPIVPFIVLCDKIKDYNYKRRVWNKEKATKILNYILPQVLEWVEEDGAFYYSMDWNYTYLWRKARRRDRKWARKFAHNLHLFVKEEYENTEYFKMIEVERYGEVWIKFVEKNS